MSSKLFGICNSLKARLSRRIVFWVFTSIVVVEAIILVPSYFRREEELFNQIEHVSEVIFNATVRWKRKGESDKVILEKIPILMSDREILGIAIYRSNGELFKVLGDAPKISFSALKNPKNNKICGTLRDGDRYDVAWSGLPQGIDYILIVRHNSSSVKHELHAFILRISGLVVIIAICVTGTTMLALGATVIVPILRLRDDLMAAAEAISKETANPNF
ncbi:MAG TPA: adenylate/guanylate cyclase domain-containing protein, partial [Cyanobacteria bacterium UBA11166]|nr:adenylate/guanylate cyclase domain-containing protein [Cyanobacteria bacterium UBA11166]